MDLEAKIKALEDTIATLRIKLLVPQHLYNNAADDFDNLKLLLSTPYWPAAVDQKSICSGNDEEKNDRARKIIDYIIDTPLEALKFLDFGCGEGHVVKNTITQKPSLSVGYDLVRHENWDKPEGCTFTTTWDEVVAKGPYNVVLLHDVLDHLIINNKVADDQQIIGVLEGVKRICMPHGKLYVRLHPWCSRHATHLYHKINKAYMHLIFTVDELKSLGLESQPCTKVIHPVLHYESWWQRAGLRILRRDITEEAIEQFFADTPLLAKRIKLNWAGSFDRHLSSGQGFPFGQVKTQFVDYVLSSS